MASGGYGPPEIPAAPGSAAGAEFSDADAVELVERMTDDKFLDFVDEFVEENAQYFDESDEQKHFYKEIHDKYKRLFESRAEAFLKERGISAEMLVSSASGDGIAGDIADELMAVADYQTFLEMMRTRRPKE
eukprot:gnl/MRDRNA2_/MRDRNA2_148292_c0_seq1.p1 gnl/MRDRNA2_/MRDRNA2_148292_c0~~gnl/MRDRNA2_/MRDRNA2_148292_c0_seq1.p1  ORF type:complete len:132 (-),score=44.22 gnl/MRDRNA2_/MRDRNA2_148292_c0_seq1:91-486(-)